MKKLLLLLLVVVGMSSCYMDVEKTVEDPKKATTVELQELVKDTVVVSVDNYNLYVFDENNLVVAKTVAIEETAPPINIFVFIVFIALALVLGVIWGLNW